MADFTPTYRAEVDGVLFEGRMKFNPTDANPRDVEFSINSFVGHHEGGAGIVGGYIHDPSGDAGPRAFAYEIDLPESFDANVRKNGQFRASLASEEIGKMTFDPDHVAKFKIDLPAGTVDFEDILKDRLALSYAEAINKADTVHILGDNETRMGGEVSEKGRGQFGHIDAETGRFSQAVEDTAKGLGQRLSGMTGVFAGAVVGGAVLFNGGTGMEAAAAAIETVDFGGAAVAAAEGNYDKAIESAAWDSAGIAAMGVGAVAAGVSGAGLAMGGVALASVAFDKAEAGNFYATIPESKNLPPDAPPELQHLASLKDRIIPLDEQVYEDRMSIPDPMDPGYADIADRAERLGEHVAEFEQAYHQYADEGYLPEMNAAIAQAQPQMPAAAEATQTAGFDPEQTRSFTTATSFKM